MIRVDLGKGGFQKKLPGKVASLNSLFKKVGGGRLGKFSSNIKNLIILGICAALAVLPHLFLTQYRAWIVSQHQKGLEDIREKTRLVEAEINKLMPYEKELRSYEKQKELVQEKLHELKLLLSSRGTPVFVLDAVSQSLPRKGWLTNLDLDVQDIGAKLQLRGRAFSNEDISDYVDKLSESVYFRDVKLNSVIDVELESAKLKAKEFHVDLAAQISYVKKKDVTTEGSGAALPSNGSGNSEAVETKN